MTASDCWIGVNQSTVHNYQINCKGNKSHIIMNVFLVHECISVITAKYNLLPSLNNCFADIYLIL